MIKKTLFNLVGVCLYAAGITCFTAPHHIAPGGASGIATLVNYVTGCPMGLFVFLFNIPFLIWIVAGKLLPKAFVISTLVTTGVLSVVMDIGAVLLPTYTGNALLASMFGGALLGTGLALVHLGSSNTGGISLLGLIIQKLRPELQMGTVNSGLNVLVVLSSAIVYRNIDSVLYALLTVYISGLFMDKILESAAVNSLMIIVADHTDKVREVFINARKGITVLKGEGGYLSEPQRVILCVATPHDCGELQKEIKEADEKALIIITDASKVSGKGFERVI